MTNYCKYAYNIDKGGDKVKSWRQNLKHLTSKQYQILREMGHLSKNVSNESLYNRCQDGILKSQSKEISEEKESKEDSIRLQPATNSTQMSMQHSIF